nr:MAG TPA: hypothetical protein [Caudoviricetes sp.]
MSEETSFRKGTIVLHTKKSYIGVVRLNLGARVGLLTPRGVVAGVKIKNLIPLQEAAEDLNHREAYLAALEKLPEGSCLIDRVGDVWYKTCSAWRCLDSAVAELEEWACSDRVRVSFPVFDLKQIDKKEV